MSDNSMRSPLGRVRGLGSAKEGIHHWWMQRVTAVALIPLTLWFVFAVARIGGLDYEAARAWIGHPLVAIALILLIAATFYHAKLGVQVVVEDYVHCEAAKLVSLLAVKFAAIILATAAIFAVLKISFGG